MDFGQEQDLFYQVLPASITTERLLNVQLCEKGRLDLAQAASYVAQICAALRYTHAQRVLHGDLKPYHVSLHGEGRVLVTRFCMQQTLDGVGLGVLSGEKAQYWSPERFMQALEETDVLSLGPTSDLYSLGVIAYEMLTENVPFDGPFHRVMKRTLQEPPRPLRESRPELPEALEPFIARVLAKAPQERYQTVDAFWAAFQQALGPDAPHSDLP